MLTTTHRDIYKEQVTRAVAVHLIPPRPSLQSVHQESGPSYCLRQDTAGSAQYLTDLTWPQWEEYSPLPILGVDKCIYPCFIKECDKIVECCRTVGKWIAQYDRAIEREHSGDVRA